MNADARGERLYRLRPWLVRILLPPAVTGTYLLVTDEVHYVGRSDTDLRRRLLAHAADGHSDYFAYDVHADARRAYEAECAAYHALKGETRNLIHPAAPAGHHVPCPFCKASVSAAQELRATLATSRRGRLESSLGDNHKEYA